jgi:tRNA pseudouridine55 synthase
LTPTARVEAYDFVAEVSGGTYIRALVRDLGRRLGCGAALERLSRRSIGTMSVDRAVGAARPLVREELLAAVVPLERMPLVPPPLHLASAEDAARFLAGAPLAAPPAAEGLVTVLDAGGTLLGVGQIAEDRLCPRVVLPTPPP